MLGRVSDDVLRALRKQPNICKRLHQQHVLAMRSLPKSRCLAVAAMILLGAGCSSPSSGAPLETRLSTGPAANAGSALDPGAIVDGHQIGEPMDCVDGCDAALALANETANERGLDPRSIEATSVYAPFVPDGAASTGGGYIVVYWVTDGSRIAIRVHCGVGACQVIAPQPALPAALPSPNDHGPLVDPLVEAPVGCSKPGLETCDEAVAVAVESAIDDGFIGADTLGDAHYYVTPIDPSWLQDGAPHVDDVVTIYVAGDHENVAETAIGVDCTTGTCRVIALEAPPPD